jgi:hypothetical protein
MAVLGLPTHSAENAWPLGRRCRKYRSQSCLCSIGRHMLYCTLTGQLLEKSVECIRVHMKGKRFQNNKSKCAVLCCCPLKQRPLC